MNRDIDVNITKLYKTCWGHILNLVGTKWGDILGDVNTLLLT